MGSLIGILSTVILVSTVCTLIFAVGAYIVARSSRDGVNEMLTDGDLPGADNIEDKFPHRGDSGAPAPQESSLFKRMQPAAKAETDTSNADDEYQWK